ncbi:Transcriptional regulatory protein FixJ [Gammaproteobacteria bacterium]
MIPITDPCVYIVDDDEAVLDSMSLLLRLKGMKSRGFASAEAFLEFWRPEHRGCLLLDWRMEGMDGPTLQQTLAERGSHLPVVFITAFGDTTKARLAFKGGAVDFLEKPLDDRLLFASIQEALKQDAWQSQQDKRQSEVASRMGRLTPRERQVLEQVLAGRRNQEIAHDLQISPRTVEVFKTRMMEKMQAQTLPDLVRMVNLEPE